MSTRRQYGDQRACQQCGMDVEWHGRDVGWIGRGGDTHCDNSGARPVDENGILGEYPHRKHRVPADVE